MNKMTQHVMLNNISYVDTRYHVKLYYIRWNKIWYKSHYSTITWCIVLCVTCNVLFGMFLFYLLLISLTAWLPETTWIGMVSSHGQPALRTWTRSSTFNKFGKQFQLGKSRQEPHHACPNMEKIDSKKHP